MTMVLLRVVTGLVVLACGGWSSTDGAAMSETDWLDWRGPNGAGVAASAAPTQWSDTENIKWAVDIAGRGFSTPIVVGDRMFLTTAVPTGRTEEPAADEAQQAPPPRPQGRGNPGGRRPGGRRPAMPREEQSLELWCLDRSTGEVVWKQTSNVVTPHEGYHRTYGSYASISPISDGERLYVSFGSFGLYCYDFDGEVIWKKDLGIRMNIRNAFGEGGGPAIWGNTLIHIFDQEGDSQIIALDKNTGVELWRRSRDEPTTWAQPLITEHNGVVQVITSGTNKVRSYDLSTGEMLWECAGLGLNAIPRPLRYQDTVLAMTGYRAPNLMAIRLGGTGDLTGTDAVLWNHTKGTSYTCSPVLSGNEYYCLTDRGALSCFDAATGEAHYQEERLPRGSAFKASPLAADGKLYLADESGRVHVVKMGPTFELIATNTLEDQFFVASPIAIDGDLYLRSQERLYCVSDE